MEQAVLREGKERKGAIIGLEPVKKLQDIPKGDERQQGRKM